MNNAIETAIRELSAIGFSDEEAKEVAHQLKKLPTVPGLDLGQQLALLQVLSYYKAELGYMKTDLGIRVDIMEARLTERGRKGAASLSSKGTTETALKSSVLASEEFETNIVPLRDKLAKLVKWSEILTDAFWVVKNAQGKTKD